MKNPPAFPRSMVSLNGPFNSSAYSDGYGMDLRDYFAAKAMQSFMVNRSLADLYSTGATTVAHQAYVVADAMLQARES